MSVSGTEGQTEAFYSPSMSGGDSGSITPPRVSMTQSRVSRQSLDTFLNMILRDCISWHGLPATSIRTRVAEIARGLVDEISGEVPTDQS